ncbi:zinc ribbon domain-containing protein [Thermodesulfobacteriota bacterium]
MRCPNCKFEQADFARECPKCGVIFEKYRKPVKKDIKKEDKEETPSAKELAAVVESKGLVREMLFQVEPDTNPVYFGGRVLLFVVLFVWGLKFMFTSVDSGAVMGSFFHLVNLPFHEAGHILFRPFGRYMTSLGGSLFQLMMPLICMGVFLVHTRDSYAASLSFWWFGQNFLDLAPYINDARRLVLPLLGGNTGKSSPYGFHDWEFILREAGIVHWDRRLALFSHKLGIIIMIVAILWAAYILFKQFKNLDLNR